ncbi:MAG: diaminopimelate epimerase [Candidatus Methylacidiphilales bacterium]
MKLKFWKMSGAGNDFVCLDNRGGQLRLNKKQRSLLCHRQFGIGADGLLLIESPARGADVDYVMRYFNADGGEAEMCGNGARCFARYVQRVTRTRKKEIAFHTPAGTIRASYHGDEVRVDLTPVKGGRLEIPVSTTQGNLIVHYADTGVPHVVVPVDDISKAPVVSSGRELRHHPEFAPRGANINFMQVRQPGHIHVRTYERGVEDETLACGTGVAASAWVARALFNFKSPIRVTVHSGKVLKVYFRLVKGCVEQVQLHGGADFIYQGEIDV